MKTVVNTDNAPAAIGAYSQAIKVGNTVYLSGQLGLEPKTMLLADGFINQARQMFSNLVAVINASGASVDNVVKLNVYLTDMANFASLNEVMSEFFKPPFPARAAIGVKELPKGALVEIDGIVVVD